MGTRFRTKMAVASGRLAAAASRAANRGEGMIIGGKVVLKLAPDALSDLAGDRVLALVSSTNGKTSTTKMLATAVAATGPVASQSTGANMTAGVIAALATGPVDAPAVLEVDEAYLPMMVAATHPKVILLGNLSRDQLDRMNEVAMVARKWRTMIAEHPEVTVVANADDPIVAFAAEQGADVVWVACGQAWTADSSVCPQCGALLRRADDDWWCTGCDRRRPTPAWQLHWADARGSATGPDGAVFDLSALALPGRFNAANATLSLAACVRLGLDPVESVRRMATVTAVSGRYSVVQIGTLRVRLLLAKNPASWTELLEVMPAGAPVIITINANAADGRDPSWLWDVPFERLRGRTVIATGNRRRDLAVRLLHADVDHVVIEDPYAPGAPLPAGTRDLDAVDCAATYTAFHWLRTDAAKDTSAGPGADR